MNAILHLPILFRLMSHPIKFFLTYFVNTCDFVLVNLFVLLSLTSSHLKVVPPIDKTQANDTASLVEPLVYLLFCTIPMIFLPTWFWICSRVLKCIFDHGNDRSFEMVTIYGGEPNLPTSDTWKTVVRSSMVVIWILLYIGQKVTFILFWKMVYNHTAQTNNFALSMFFLLFNCIWQIGQLIEYADTVVLVSKLFKRYRPIDRVE